MRLFEYLSTAFVAEGADTVFGLMGDGNMAWMAAMENQPGVRVVHARHEAAAVAMADGYARATGRVGVASVTCGPGLTQIGTSLTAAVRRRSTIVILTGDTPVYASYHLQSLDQAPVVKAAGAEYLRVGDATQALNAVAQAFQLARNRRCPVVLSIPYDIQELDQQWPEIAEHSDDFLVAARPPLPNEDDVVEVLTLLESAKSPVLLVGAGAVSAGCRQDVLDLAARFGAYTATTLRAKGWLDDEPCDLGVAGGFARESSREVLEDADVILALGASLSHHTTDGGKLFSLAEVVQVDLSPIGYNDGQRVADRYVRADAGEMVRGLLARAGRSVPDRPAATVAVAEPESSADRSPTLVDGIPVFDPSDVVRVLDAAIPKSSAITCGIGHFWNFVVPALTGRGPSRYHFTYEFGAIGQALPTGIGVAVAEDADGAVIIEGDGSLLMNVQELETLARHKLPVLLIVINDGAYGAEYHKLPLSGCDANLAVFGWTNFAPIAEGFGIQAHCPSSLDDVRSVIEQFHANPVPTLVDIRIDYRVVSPQFKRRFLAENSELATV